MEFFLNTTFTEHELSLISACDNAVPVLPPAMLCVSPTGGLRVFIKQMKNEHWGLFCFVDDEVLHFIKPQNPSGYISQDAALRAFRAISSTGVSSDFLFVDIPYSQ